MVLKSALLQTLCFSEFAGIFCLACGSLVVLVNMMFSTSPPTRWSYKQQRICLESTTWCVHSSKAGRSAKKLRAWISPEFPKFCWVGFELRTLGILKPFRGCGSGEAVKRRELSRNLNIPALGSQICILYRDKDKYSFTQSNQPSQDPR